MKNIFPQKLQQGDVVRIIAPSKSLSTVSKDIQNIAKANLKSLG